MGFFTCLGRVWVGLVLVDSRGAAKQDVRIIGDELRDDGQATGVPAEITLGSARNQEPRQEPQAVTRSVQVESDTDTWTQIHTIRTRYTLQVGERNEVHEHTGGGACTSGGDPGLAPNQAILG